MIAIQSQADIVSTMPGYDANHNHPLSQRMIMRHQKHPLWQLCCIQRSSIAKPNSVVNWREPSHALQKVRWWMAVHLVELRPSV
jgi:hypothetical protein